MKKGKGNPLIPFFSPICVLLFIHLSSAATNISPEILLNCGVPSSSVVEGSIGIEKGQGQLLMGAGLVEEKGGVGGTVSVWFRGLEEEAVRLLGGHQIRVRVSVVFSGRM